nr:MAG TPA: hypothetical protein [Caudoviricetes sp.]
MTWMLLPTPFTVMVWSSSSPPPLMPSVSGS